MPQIAVIIEFRRFKADPQRRELLLDGHPVELGGRLFDLLMALVETRGSVTSKDELMRRVWPGRIVDENNLQGAISSLRNVLGPDRDVIRTITGRGYMFTADIRESAPSPVAQYPTNLPTSTQELIGREAALSEVQSALSDHRLLTLTGAGGIGKTRLALEVAHRLRQRFPNGVWLSDLSPLTDPELVPGTVANALGLSASDMTPERIRSKLRDQSMLVLLDNCEHVINAAAHMATQLLLAAPNVSVISTSRESLRADGEWVYQVPPLDLPREGMQTEQEILNTGAAKLFITRALAAQPQFRLEPDVVARLGFICRRLDGIPLAIELAAARAASLGVQEVAARLDDRFRILTGGRRTALPRHQTLRATFDWGYELLSESERLTLCRLGVFSGEFTLDAADHVLSDPENNSYDVAEHVGLLAAKSLMSISISAGVARYRMLETTRAYAVEKLLERGEFARFARRHARYLLEVFESTSIDRLERPSAIASPEHSRLLDDARAALDWAFSKEGDTYIGAKLTAAMAPVWIRRSLVSEWVDRIHQALRAVALDPSHDLYVEMELNAALSVALITLRGNDAEGFCAANTALLIAERLGDTDFQLSALMGLYQRSAGITQPFAHALAIAKRITKLGEVSDDSTAQSLGDVLTAYTLLHMGELAGATRHIEATVRQDVSRGRRLPLVVDDETSRIFIRAHTLWLQGFQARSMRIINQAVDDMIERDHTITLTHALGLIAAPLAFLSGDLPNAERHLSLLVEQRMRAPTQLSDNWASGLQGVLLVKHGEIDRGVQELQASFQNRSKAGASNDPLFTAVLAEALGALGRSAAAIAILDNAIADTEITQIRWFLAEYFRIKGEILLLSRTEEASVEAEGCYLRSLDWSRRQGALTWELRAATSLARLQLRKGRAADASDVLRRVYAKFTEGFEMADLAMARALLNELPPSPAG